MCCDSKAPAAPAPDPAIGQAAAQNAEIGNKWLDFSKEQFAKGEQRQDVYDNLINKVVNSQLGIQDKTANWAGEDRAAGKQALDQFGGYANKAENYGQAYGDWLGSVANDFGAKANDQFAFGDSQRGRYGNTFVPIENRIASDAMGWDSDARLASEAAKARGDVLDSSARARDASARSMAAMGINPLSGRFAGQQHAADLQESLAAAGAENAARDTARQQAQTLRGQAAQLGQQVLGTGQAATSLGLQARQAQQNATQAAYGVKSSGLSQAQQAETAGLAALGIGNTSANTSLNAGSSAVGAGGAGNQSFIANNGIMGQGYSGAMQGYANQGNILNNLYGSQLQGWGMQQQANAQNSAGIGSAVGSLVGAGAALY